MSDPGPPTLVTAERPPYRPLSPAQVAWFTGPGGRAHMERLAASQRWLFVHISGRSLRDVKAWWDEVIAPSVSAELRELEYDLFLNSPGNDR